MSEEKFISANLTEAAPCMYEALSNAVRMCQSIMNGFGNPDIDHKQFRVQVAQWAEEFLNDDAKVLDKVTGKNDK